MLAHNLTDADDVTFSSKTFLHLIGQKGLVGVWSWRFAANEHVWSSSFFSLLGLEPRQMTPSYDLFVSLVHPADRSQLPAVGRILEGIVPRQAVLRVLGLDGMERVLSVLMEMRFAPDGRPCAINAIALDVTDRARLDHWRRLDQQCRWGRYASTHTTPFRFGLDGLYDFPADVADVHGLPQEAVRATPYLMIVPEERAAVHARYLEQLDGCQFFQGTVHERLATGEICQFRLVSAPIWDEEGAFLGRTGFKYPAHRTDLTLATGELLLGLLQAVEGHHIRAARALLDWSMSMLAAASGLSLSTVRRIEENAFPRSDRSRYRIVETLREAGIRFTATDEGDIAISRR